MTAELSVRHLAEDQFAIDVRGHFITVDQPRDDGGQDAGPTPTELFVAGLASCVAFYARRYLARHGIPADGLGVTASYLIGARPARVTSITLHLTAPAALPPERREAFLAVATHCTVHNTLKEPPPIELTMS